MSRKLYVRGRSQTCPVPPRAKAFAPAQTRRDRNIYKLKLCNSCRTAALLLAAPAKITVAPGDSGALLGLADTPLNVPQLTPRGASAQRPILGNLKLQCRREAVEIHGLAQNAGDNAESARRNVMPRWLIAYRGFLSFSVF